MFRVVFARAPDKFLMSNHVQKQLDYMSIFYFYLVCFTFYSSYSLLPFHLVCFFNFSISSFFTVFLKPISSIVEKPLCQFSSVTQSCPALCNPWTAALQASLSITNSQSSPKTTSIESVMPSNHLLLCRPLLLLPSIFPSIKVFSNESALHIGWPKYWSFSFSISSSNEHPGLISFRMHWLDLLAVQGTLKTLLQHHSLKASILWRSAFFTVQLSHPYMTTGKTIALTRPLFAK